MPVSRDQVGLRVLPPNRSLLPLDWVSSDSGHTPTYCTHLGHTPTYCTYLALSISRQQSIDLSDSKKQSHLDSENGEVQPPNEGPLSLRVEDTDVQARTLTLVDVDGDGFIDAEDVDILSQWFLF
jgi:hypothetical protein